jgi:hypothetical protein
MATTVDDLVIEIRAETAGLRKGLSDVDKRLGKANKSAKRSILNFGQLAKVFAAIGVIKIGAFIVNTARQFEDLGATMRAVTGSVANANVAMETIKEFTAKTPFQVQEVTSAFIKFYQAGVTPSDEALTAFGNLAAGMGRSIETVAQAVFNATTGEMEMLKQFGIKARQLGDEVSFNFEGQVTVVKNSRDAIAGYIQTLGATRFPTALQERLNTMSGSFSNLQDKAGLFSLAVGEAGLTGGMTRLAMSLQGTVDAAGEKGLAKSLGSALAGALDKVTAGIVYLNENTDKVILTLKVLGAVIATIIAVNIMGGLITSLGVLSGVLALATKAVMGFNLAMLANPVFLIIAAIAALIAVGVLLWKNWDKVRVFFKNLFTVHLPNFIDKGKIAFVEFKLKLINVINELLVDLQPKINKLVELYNAIPWFDEIAPIVLQIDTSGAESDLDRLEAKIRERTRQLEVYVEKVTEGTAAVVAQVLPVETAGGAVGTIVPPGTGDDLDDTKGAAERLKTALGDLKQSIIDSTHAFTTDFVDALLSGENAMDSFKNFAKSMVSQVIATFMQLAVVNQILNSIFGLTGADAFTTMGSAKAGKAGGGKIQAGVPTLVGERGAEIFIPDTSGRIATNQALAGGGGPQIIVHQEMNFALGVVPTVRAEVAKMMPQIAETSKMAVLEASARGGSYRRALLGGS